MNKTLAIGVAVLMLFSATASSVFAVGAKEAGASLLLPTTGQAMNNQIASSKTKVMAGIENSIEPLKLKSYPIGLGIPEN